MYLSESKQAWEIHVRIWLKTFCSSSLDSLLPSPLVGCSRGLSLNPEALTLKPKALSLNPDADP